MEGGVAEVRSHRNISHLRIRTVVLRCGEYLGLQRWIPGPEVDRESVQLPVFNEANASGSLIAHIEHIVPQELVLNAGMPIHDVRIPQRRIPPCDGAGAVVRSHKLGRSILLGDEGRRGRSLTDAINWRGIAGSRLLVGDAHVFVKLATGRRKLYINRIEAESATEHPLFLWMPSEPEARVEVVVVTFIQTAGRVDD